MFHLIKSDMNNQHNKQLASHKLRNKVYRGTTFIEA